MELTLIASNISVSLNLLSYIFSVIIIIVYHRKSFRDLAMGRYLSMLAVFDPLLMTFGISITRPDISIYSSITCKMLRYIFMVIYQICPWISCTMQVDRLVSVIFPKRFQIKNTFKFQIGILSAIAIVTLGTNIPFAIYSELVATTNATMVCNCKMVVVCAQLNLSRLFIATIIPFVIMFTCTISIFVSLIRSKSKFSKSFNAKRELGLFKTMIGLDLFFFICNAPLCIVLYFGSSSTGQVQNTVAFRVAVLLVDCHHALALLVYLITNKLFREEFLVLFAVKSAQNTNTIISGTRTKMDKLTSNQLK